MGFLVALHNILRWVVVVLAVYALIRAYNGWLRGKEYIETDRKAGVFFGIAMDTQLLLGIILWIFGDWGYQSFGLAAGLEGSSRMTLLYFAVEHAFTMLLAVIFVHVGTIMTRRATTSVAKHKRTAILFTIAVLLVLVAVPWAQRPLFPGLSPLG
jgi:hypothetical protein